ncbi:MAG: NAD(P)H-dependent oxidoreductase [Promethearchaeota archaeon]
MSTNKKALLLIGSPRGENSTSASLGNYLISKLEEYEMLIEKGFIHRLVNREEAIQKLFRMIESADLIILTFPLYVDSLPAPIIKAMELIKEERDKSESKKSHSFIAICNSGFPEASQSMVALQICRIFANDCGFVWHGGVALGGGGAINGAPLQEKGGMVRNVIKGLDIIAHALKDGKDIPQEAIDLFSKKFIPSALYKMFGNLGWKIQARRYGVRKKLKNKQYSL